MTHPDPSTTSPSRTDREDLPYRSDSDPDRFLDDATPGSQEWWYFDAIGEDQRDALVLVWYASLPFDPDYGVAMARSKRSPSKYRPPNPRDHCAFGFSWYRDGKTAAYALNGYREGQFAHRADPFQVTIDTSVLDRDDRGYRLRFETPLVDGRRRVRGDLRFDPRPNIPSWETDFGHDRSPHLWMLAAPDCQVTGQFEIVEGDSILEVVSFQGRGYHDHNAGREEIREAMTRWSWGRVHLPDFVGVYYHAKPRLGSARSVWIQVCGSAHELCVIEPAQHIESMFRRNNFGVRYSNQIRFEELDGEASGLNGLVRTHTHCVDTGPFYLRWLSTFDASGCREVLVEEDADPAETTRLGITEHLETSNLHRPWFNWMIPYRLKRPKPLG